MGGQLPDLPPVFRLAEARALGLSVHAVRGAVQRGALRRVGHGLYAVGRVSVQDGERWAIVRDDHLRRCREELARHPGHAASHLTAAVVHGMALTLHPRAEVHLTCIDNEPRSRRENGAVLHHSDSVENETVVVDGIRVTTPGRTCADVMRTMRKPNSVALVDQALRAGLVTEHEVRRALDMQRRWRGRPRAREAMDLVDPRRESWLESYSFVTLHEIGLPVPLPQVDVLDGDLNFVGRVDGLLDGVFLEADGQDKYFLDSVSGRLSPEQSAVRRIASERGRHDALEALGLVGVRWTTDEIRNRPGVVAARVQAGLRRADPTAFTGWIRWEGRLHQTAFVADLLAG
jgi:hypothetical protein